jgi:two-component system LytT family response regulator
MNSLRVLIVDDEPLARERIRDLLSSRPEIEIVGECSNGKEAVTALRRDRPDLVFLDVQMPDLDGFGVLEEIDPDTMPAVIFVTAYDEYAVRAFEVHASIGTGSGPLSTAREASWIGRTVTPIVGISISGFSPCSRTCSGAKKGSAASS